MSDEDAETKRANQLLDEALNAMKQESERVTGEKVLPSKEEQREQWEREQQAKKSAAGDNGEQVPQMHDSASPRDEDDPHDHRERQRQSKKRRDEDEKIEVPEGVRLLEYLNRPPKSEDTLFGNRWLCRKGTSMLIGPSGIGKSTLILQGSAYWSAGLPFLNIAPRALSRS